MSRRRAMSWWVAVLLLTAACERSVEPPAPTTSTAATSTSTTSTSTSSTSTSSTSTSSTSTSTSTTSTSTSTSTTSTTIPTTTIPTTTIPTTIPVTIATTTTPATTVVPTTVRPGAASTAVFRLPTDDPVVALTFDAGSDLGYASSILDTLAEFGVSASFGITGAFAEAHPDVIRRIADEGHVVMNHSDDHPSFTGTSSDDVVLTTEDRQAELRRADEVIAPLIGRSTVPYWRPPFGDYDDGVLADVGAIGYATTVMWTIDSLGWKGLTADEIIAHVLERLEPGAIIVMHVGSQSQDGPALPALITALRDRGYSFATVAAA